jgi:hypothetical protein
MIFDWPGVRLGPQDWDNFESQEEFRVGADDERFTVVVNPESDGGEGHSSAGQREGKSLVRKKLSGWFYRVKYKYWVLQARWRAAGQKGKHGKKTRVFEPPLVEIWRISCGALPRQVALLTLKFEKFAQIWSLLIKELGKPSYLYSNGLTEAAQDDLFNLRQFQPGVPHHYVEDVADLKLLKECVPTPTCSLVVPPRRRTTSCPIEPKLLAAYHAREDVWDGPITPNPIAIDGKYYLLFRSEALLEALAFGFDGIHDHLRRVVDRYQSHPDALCEVVVGRITRFDNHEVDDYPRLRVIDHLSLREEILEETFSLLPPHPRTDREMTAEMTVEWQTNALILMSDLVRMFDADFLTRSVAPKHAAALRGERERFQGAVVAALHKIGTDPNTAWVSTRYAFFSLDGYKYFPTLIHADEEYFKDHLAKAIDRAVENCCRIMRQAIENARELALLGLPPVPIAALAMDDIYQDATRSFRLGHFREVTRLWHRQQPLPGSEEDDGLDGKPASPEKATTDKREGDSPRVSDHGLALDLATKDPVRFRQALGEWEINSLKLLTQLHETAPDFAWGLNLVPPILRSHFESCQLASRTLRKIGFYAGTIGEHQVAESERTRIQWMAKAHHDLNDQAFTEWRDIGSISEKTIARMQERGLKLDEELKKWATLMDGSALVRSPVRSLLHRWQQLLAKRLWRKAERIQHNRIQSWQRKSP